MSWVFYILASINWKQLWVSCYQYSHFIDEETEAGGTNEATIKWKKFFLESVFIETVKFMGMDTDYLDDQHNKSISILCIKKNEVYNLVLLSNVLGVLQALLNLIKKKMYKVSIIKNPIL